MMMAGWGYYWGYARCSNLLHDCVTMSYGQNVVDTASTIYSSKEVQEED